MCDALLCGVAIAEAIEALCDCRCWCWLSCLVFVVREERDTGIKEMGVFCVDCDFYCACKVGVVCVKCGGFSQSVCAVYCDVVVFFDVLLNFFF